jgi:hypothetical protein
LERKNDPPLATRIPVTPRLPELWPLFPVMFNMNSNNTYNGLDMNLIKDFKKTCVTYGPASPFCREYLAGWSNDAGWIPYDFHIVAKITLSSAEFCDGKCELSDEAHENVSALGQQGNVGSVLYEMLTGTGTWLSQDHQVKIHPLLLCLICMMLLWLHGTKLIQEQNIKAVIQKYNRKQLNLILIL